MVVVLIVVVVVVMVVVVVIEVVFLVVVVVVVVGVVVVTSSGSTPSGAIGTKEGPEIILLISRKLSKLKYGYGFYYNPISLDFWVHLEINLLVR